MVSLSHVSSCGSIVADAALRDTSPTLVDGLTTGQAQVFNSIVQMCTHACERNSAQLVFKFPGAVTLAERSPDKSGVFLMEGQHKDLWFLSVFF